tara:strand:- start:20416 stop:20895 length:480 start_codon:yes stop_codon:yes gene_type:complete
MQYRFIQNLTLFLLISSSLSLGANNMEINNDVKQVIYGYADIIDSRRFDELNTIMWDDFTMTGVYDLKGIDGFMGAMDQLVSMYERTMHFIGNIEGQWEGDIYKGKTYCIASHIYKENDKYMKLDMGIIYEDTLERRDGSVKFVNRNFNLQWMKTDQLD